MKSNTPPHPLFYMLPEVLFLACYGSYQNDAKVTTTKQSYLVAAILNSVFLKYLI